ncbi:hypothetical protein LUW77_15595 [Streptomyces radiopugnans]|nr:hypothetical protein LUW77_15595 [Streptomyces radiopugnans]
MSWSFRAVRGSFGSWRLVPGTLRRHPAPGGAEGEESGPERLLLDARAVLGWDGPTTAEALRELTATRRAEAEVIARDLPAAALADLDHLELESHQDGHPCMLLNKGRLGFSASDAAAYAPEAAGDEVRLRWAAVHTTLASYAGIPGLDAQALLSEELDPAVRERFAAALADACAQGPYTPGDFVWLPVHPFHWDEAVATLFAPYLADGRIVPLGEGPDRYRPLQSIRTLANLDHPGRRNVKVPLLIRNTLVWRGLSTEPTRAAPDISAWLHAIRDTDPYLRDELRFHPLGEVASVAVRHPLYESVADAPYRYHELLGAVWREPVTALLRDGEKARTMAALLKTGSDGKALVAELVERSGLTPRAWLARFLAALLPGLLHCLYRHGIAFCPHGENTVVVHDAREVPVGIALKDFAEDVNLLPGRRPEYAGLPPRADAVLLRWLSARAGALAAERRLRGPLPLPRAPDGGASGRPRGGILVPGARRGRPLPRPPSRTRRPIRGVRPARALLRPGRPQPRAVAGRGLPRPRRTRRGLRRRPRHRPQPPGKRGPLSRSAEPAGTTVPAEPAASTEESR